MNEVAFRALAIIVVVDYFNNLRDVTDSKPITHSDVYVVWMCKILQNNKALLSTTVSDGMYYEVTWNGDKNECYLDAYKKVNNRVLRAKDKEHEAEYSNL